MKIRDDRFMQRGKETNKENIAIIMGQDKSYSRMCNKVLEVLYIETPPPQWTLPRTIGIGKRRINAHSINWL